MLLFVSRFAAPLGKTRFSAPVPAGATPPAQLLPMLQFGFCAPVQVNVCARPGEANPPSASRSEEHTSELQSRPHSVCRLLLEKKKTTAQGALFVEKNRQCDWTIDQQSNE